MSKIVFNPFTGTFDFVKGKLSDLDDVNSLVSPNTGSLLAGDGTVFSELSVGADGYVLVANSAAPSGLTWVPNSPNVLSYTSASVISVGDLVAMNSSGDVVLGSVVYSSGIWKIIGVALTAANPTDPVSVGISGSFPINFSVAPAANTNGDPVFLDAASGKATLNPLDASGNIIFMVGTLTGADGITTNPSVIFEPQYISRRV